MRSDTCSKFNAQHSYDALKLALILSFAREMLSIKKPTEVGLF